MKISYASDLHLEFKENTRYMEDNPLIPTGEILLLAGDIHFLKQARSETYYPHPFWDWVSANFRQTLVVAGNHEYYKGRDLSRMTPGSVADIRPNIQLCHNAIVTIGDVDFILTTLWGRIPALDAYMIENNVSDFSQINYGHEYFSASDFNREHRKSIAFLRDAVNKSANKKVVVTHHVPTELCTSPDFKGSKLNSAFVVELHDFIFDSPIDYWVYGHSHRNMPDVDINGTKLVCNQLGYIMDDEESSFKADVFFEI